MLPSRSAVQPSSDVMAEDSNVAMAATLMAHFS
jgi:hypothetical protein